MDFSILVWIFIAIVLFIVFLQAYIIYESRKYKNIPGPTPLPIVGNSLEFTCEPAELFKKLMHYRKVYGLTHQVSIGMKKFIFSSDVELIEQLLSSHKHIDKSDDYKLLYKWIGDGLLTTTGSKWKTRRRIITPAFHFKILENFIEVFNSSSNIFVEKLSEQIDKESFDVYPYITLHALDIICETAMGTSINAQKNSSSEYVMAVRNLCNIIFLRMFSCWKQFDFLFQFSADFALFNKSIDILHEMTESVIKSRREQLLQAQEENVKGEEKNEDPSSVYFGKKKRQAFLDILLEATVDGQPLSDADIREEVDTFMFEGHDTVSSAISFAFHCLAKYPKEQEKVFKEQQEIFGEDKKINATHNDLQNMKYLDLFIKEVLRIYPSVPFIARKLNEEMTFKGNLFPKGSIIVMELIMMHRDAEYFTNPEEFCPERFLDNSERNSFLYVPFSAGLRNCIGQKFAVLEMKSTLSAVIRNFEILSSHSVDELDLVSAIVLKAANGIQIQLKQRQY